MHAGNYTFMYLLGNKKLQLKIFLIQIALILFDIFTVLSLSHVMNGLGNYITLQILLAQADIRIWKTNLAGKLLVVSCNSLRKMKNRISFTLSHRLQNQKYTLVFVKKKYIQFTLECPLLHFTQILYGVLYFLLVT